MDSMPFHAMAWVKAFEEIGIHMVPEQIYGIEGANHIGVIERIFAAEGKTPDREQFGPIADRKREIFFEIEKSTAFEGMPECLEALKTKYRLAVVSGSTRPIVEELVSRFYPGTFDIIVSGSDVDAGKPAPDPYLKAVEMLGLPPGRCMVVENAPFGVEAARNAGLFCIAVPTYVEPDTLSKADIIAADHRELIACLRSLL